MITERSPLGRALDLFLYAPLGLALTVVEELPELAEKGRARFDRHTTTARVVGQFAVAEGRRRLRLVDPAAPAPGAARPPVNGSAAADTREDTWGREDLTDPREDLTDPREDLTDPRPPAAPAGPDSSHPAAPTAPQPAARTTAGPTPPRPQRAAEPAPDSAGLAIPGYDSLSAPQVVQRLESLSVDELAAVAAYESAVRGRRTILARIAQLQQG